MANLTEDNIKTAALRYLKWHYRHWPRSGDVLAELDMRARGGIVIDGSLTLPQADGTSFTVAFEATSYETRHELKYLLMYEKLGWDSMVGALLMVSAAMAWAQYKAYNLVQMAGTVEFLGLLAAAIALLSGLYYAFFSYSSIHRYRYIYAIEQFKSYYADEQWVVFGEDAFPNNRGQYYKELQRQCVRSGFGLIRMGQDLDAHILLSPARQDVFASTRSQVRWVRLAELTQRIGQVGYKDWLQKFNGKLRTWLAPYHKGELFRFNKFPTVQFGICVSCLIVLASLFILQWSDSPIRYVNERIYPTQLKAAADTMRVESDFYMIDPPEDGKSENTKRERLKRALDTATIVAPIASISNDDEQLQKPADLLIMRPGQAEPLAADCARLTPGDLSRYVVQDTVVAGEQGARRRLAQLQGAGLRANAIWRGCFAPGQDGYALFFEGFFTDSLSAVTEADNYRILTSAKGLRSKLTVLKVNQQ